MKPEKNSENEEEIEKLQQANLKLMQDIVKLEEKLSSCNTCLTKAEEIALKKQSRITELEINTTLLEKQLETLPILNAQVNNYNWAANFSHVWMFLNEYLQIELYKTDFEAERDARQNLAGEKETLAQELRLLKRKLIATDQAAIATPVAAAAASLVEQEDVNSYSCPKCNFNFSSMDSLNNHLDVCLNQQMFPWCFLTLSFLYQILVSYRFNWNFPLDTPMMINVIGITIDYLLKPMYCKRRGFQLLIITVPLTEETCYFITQVMYYPTPFRQRINLWLVQQ